MEALQVLLLFVIASLSFKNATPEAKEEEIHQLPRCMPGWPRSQSQEGALPSFSVL